ncbi:hypothetical protein DNHGIG_11690 [Collibacillus ludicampi]|uniref:SLH domain-containing protein n=1 Tax=Collibacillus ludicampi TaxID=2771369 RepID=A0AAV4LCT5_9BACL|nr:S-layer homology domain-containing protein [Collibacillus ludicampi]GIM45620.1 hypothetical protein DNHGIG_11690 [Collibacillus ludicampi]
MKKMVTTLSVLSTLSLSAVPAFAQSNGNIKIVGKGHAVQNIHITNTTNIINNKIELNDINGHWAEKYIRDLVGKGILSGKGNKRFEPNATVKRDEFATMVTRYFHLKNTSNTQDFNDVPPNSWEFKYVEAAKDYFDKFRDLIGGYDFHPEDGARRQDVTVTLVKILMQLDPSIQLMDADSADQLLHENFSDADQITPALRPYVATAVKYDLVHGNKDGTFAPNRVLTRAEAATLLDRLQNTGVAVDVGSTTTTSGDATSAGTTVSDTGTDSGTIDGTSSTGTTEDDGSTVTVGDTTGTSGTTTSGTGSDNNSTTTNTTTGTTGTASSGTNTDNGSSTVGGTTTSTSDSTTGNSTDNGSTTASGTTAGTDGTTSAGTGATNSTTTTASNQ